MFETGVETDVETEVETAVHTHGMDLVTRDDGPLIPAGIEIHSENPAMRWKKLVKLRCSTP